MLSPSKESDEEADTSSPLDIKNVPTEELNVEYDVGAITPYSQGIKEFSRFAQENVNMLDTVKMEFSLDMCYSA